MPQSVVPPPTNIGAWARFALTGDSQSPAPTDPALQFITPGILADFLLANPCVADGNGGYSNSNLDDADINAVEEALGALVAERFLGTPAGVKFAGDTTQMKLGPLTKTRAAADIHLMQSNCIRVAAAARRRVSCVRAAIIAGGTVELFGLAGRSRAAQEKYRNGF